MSRPLIAPSELEALTAEFGPQPHHHGALTGEGWWEEVRRSLAQRRGEVLLVVQRPGGEVLVHTKRFYPPGTYRLLSGGVGWAETAWAALHREMAEETGLPIRSATWWGLITYTLYPTEEARQREDPALALPFVSFVFHVRTEGDPRPADAGEAISGFRWIRPADLPEVAQRLEALNGPWQGWGRFRAVGHRFVWMYHRERLEEPEPPGEAPRP